jgi:hypothetical protein
MNNTNTIQPTSLSLGQVAREDVPSIPMFNIGGLPVKKKSAKTDYPVVPDDGTLAPCAARFLVNKEIVEAAEGAMDADRGVVTPVATEFYFATNHGRQDAPSSVVVNSSEGELRVTFPDKYKGIVDPKEITAIVGATIASTHFHQAWSLTVKGSELPATAATQKLLNDVVALFKAAGAEHAIEFKAGIKPKKGFGALRHTVLSVAQNLALNRICPIITTFNTKGRE